MMVAQDHSDTVGGEFLTTGQVARRFKVTLQTLHFYEDEGLVTPTRANGRRSYDHHNLNRLAFILQQKRLGRSLAEIALLLASSQCMITLSDMTTSLPTTHVGV